MGFLGRGSPLLCSKNVDIIEKVTKTYAKIMEKVTKTYIKIMEKVTNICLYQRFSVPLQKNKYIYYATT